MLQQTMCLRVATEDSASASAAASMPLHQLVAESLMRLSVEADAAAEEDAALLEEVVEHGGSEEEDLDHDASDASSGIEAV